MLLENKEKRFVWDDNFIIKLGVGVQVFTIFTSF